MDCSLAQSVSLRRIDLGLSSIAGLGLGILFTKKIASAEANGEHQRHYTYDSQTSANNADHCVGIRVFKSNWKELFHVAAPLDLISAAWSAPGRVLYGFSSGVLSLDSVGRSKMLSVLAWASPSLFCLAVNGLLRIPSVILVLVLATSTFLRTS